MTERNTYLGENIRKLRKEQGLSQERLARLADVSNNTVIKLEAGENMNPTLDTLGNLSRALNVTIDELVAVPLATIVSPPTSPTTA